MLKAALIAVSLAFALSATTGHADQPHIVGGPCEYKNYPGKAEIISVEPTPPRPQAAKPAFPPYTVMFRFRPQQNLHGEGLYVEGKLYRLTLPGGADPGPRFLEKYKIRPGSVLDCQIRFIRKGTCTPVLFFFPGIDLADPTFLR